MHSFLYIFFCYAFSSSRQKLYYSTLFFIQLNMTNINEKYFQPNILYFALKPQPNTFFVFNPATHESTWILDALTPYRFDHTILAYGFHYAPSINDYKLVKAVNAPLVAVFSLKTSAWKLVEVFHNEKLVEHTLTHVNLVMVKSHCTCTCIISSKEYCVLYVKNIARLHKCIHVMTIWVIRKSL